jgi:hypothetical protein
MKKVADRVYVHISALDTLPQELQEKVHKAAARLPNDYHDKICKYNMLKVSTKENSVSFIWCPRFDLDDEPAIAYSLLVVEGKEVRQRDMKYYHVHNPPIYHGKHLFVGEDYTGFDVSMARERYLAWSRVNSPLLNRVLIGRQKYWQEIALPELKRLGCFEKSS